MTLAQDWQIYKSDPTTFTKSHFEGLMLELLDEADLSKAFADLPNGHEFVKRIGMVRAGALSNGTYLYGKPSPTTGTDRSLARTYRDHVYDFLKDIGDPEASLMRDLEIVEISRDDYRLGKKSGTLKLLHAPMTIEDEYIDAELDGPRWLSGLYEATYMMTTIPEVTRFLLAPFIAFPFDDTPAMKLWLRGHRIDFSESGVLLISQNHELEE